MNPAQQRVLDVIEMGGRWNAFDGPRIVHDLAANTSSWRSVCMSTGAVPIGLPELDSIYPFSFSFLRFLADGEPNFDTLLILVEPACADILDDVCGQWGADANSWIGYEYASDALSESEAEWHQRGGSSKRIIKYLWWD